VERNEASKTLADLHEQVVEALFAKEPPRDDRPGRSHQLAAPSLTKLKTKFYSERTLEYLVKHVEDVEWFASKSDNPLEPYPCADQLYSLGCAATERILAQLEMGSEPSDFAYRLYAQVFSQVYCNQHFLGGKPGAIADITRARDLAKNGRASPVSARYQRLLDAMQNGKPFWLERVE
jgi:hypothetical protein